MQVFTVPEDLDNQRIDLALCKIMNAYSRSRIQHFIRLGLVDINNKTAKKGMKVRTNDHISVREQELESSRFLPSEIPLDIVYEDEDMIVVNKPAGMLTHPSPLTRENTLVNALLHHCGDSLSGIGGEHRPGIVHRLDKDTSGVIMVAKHDHSHKDLAKQIQERHIEKWYYTLCSGSFKETSGSIDAPLLKTNIAGKNRVIVSESKEARPALTHFWVEERFEEDFSLLKVRIITGRMHQIRAHLASIKHPVVGDLLYGPRKNTHTEKLLGLQRQFLHAWKLKVKHPKTQQIMEFSAPLPPDLSSCLDTLRQEYK